METFFAYSRILRKRGQRLQPKDQTPVSPVPPSGQPSQAKRKGLLERLRLASACQSSDP